MPLQRFGLQLQRRLERVRQWPPRREQDLWDEIDLWQAFRDSDRSYLARYSGRDEARYMIDPLPKLISEAYADLLFSRAPEFVAQADGDQDQLDEMLSENEMVSELKVGARDQSAEGEIWWRIFADPQVADWPLLEWHSRNGVIPLWVGKKLRAVAFFSRLDDISPVDTKSEAMLVHRHVELHEPGWVHNFLYEGRRDSLGKTVDLAKHPDTEGLREEWNHNTEDGKGLLAGWIPNDVTVKGRRGQSDYQPIMDMLFELNESLETGKANRRLVARKRLAGPSSALDNSGFLDPEQEFLVVEQSDLPGDNRQPGVVTVEYSFDAQALTHWMNDTAVKALSRIGMAAEFTGVPTDATGAAESGVHLRLKLIPTSNKGDGKYAPFGSQLPKIIRLMQQVAALDVADGGFGTGWANMVDLPKIERQSTLPEDRVERASRLALAVTGTFMSRRTAIKEDHPDWDDDLVNEELKEIAKDVASEHPVGPADGAPNLFTGRTPSERTTPPADQQDQQVQADGVGVGQGEGQ